VNTQSQEQIISSVAHDLVAVLAPEEMPLFPANSRAFFMEKQKAAKPAGRDDMLGFGTAEAISLLTPVAMSVASEVIKFVTEEVKKSLKTESSTAIGDLVKSIFKKYRPAGENGTRPAPVRLSMDQLQEVHKMAFEKARQLKLSEARARRLADALIGDLVSPG
jgi:hypothetical protein